MSRPSPLRFPLPLLCLGMACMVSSCGKPEPATGRADPGDDPNAADLRSGAEIGEIPVGDHRREWKELDDPRADGWKSEQLATLAKRQLDLLGTLMLGDTPASADDVRPLLAGNFSSSALIPADLSVVFRDPLVSVERAATHLSPTGVSGPAQFALAVNTVAADFRGATDAQCKFKVFEIDLADDRTFETRQYVSISGRTRSGVVEQHATWSSWWASSLVVGAMPKLTRLEVSEFERSSTNEAHARPLLADCTEAILGQNACYTDQLLRGMNHWLERIPYRAALGRMGTPGIALGDANGDGLDDLYLCQESGLPNRLFLQQPDGRLEDVSAAWGVDWLQDSRSGLLADFDNDGRQDLAVAIFGGVVVARNEGDRFEIQTVLTASESTTSLTAADYDRDGRLDLYICAYSPDRTLEGQPQAIGPLGGRFVFHDSENGSPNTLFQNEISAESGWTFTDVTAAVGLDANSTRWSFAASWDDFDNDGDQDLYVANDYGRNCLYENETTPDGTVRFRDVAAAAGAEDSASGMSAAWGDYDRDGWMDLYVGNMFSAAGSRVTRQAKFKPEISTDLRRKFQHFARGNTLLRNLGRPGEAGFEDPGSATGVTVGRWAWGSTFADLNNDGWEDILVANGYLTGDDSGGDL